MSGNDRRKIGLAAEEKALEFLQARGLRLEARNYRCRGGEIDLVMRDGIERVFVEVRFRKSERFGSPEATVDAAKQQRIAIAATRFLSQHDDRPCRFDVVALSGHPPRIQWYRNAFEVSAWRT